MGRNISVSGAAPRRVASIDDDDDERSTGGVDAGRRVDLLCPRLLSDIFSKRVLNCVYG